ncbi:MAG: hypothetical protein VCB43_03830, partial [Myxococcota bacterium]
MKPNATVGPAASSRAQASAARASVNVDSNTISGHDEYGVYIETNFESPTSDTLRYNTIINNDKYGIR